MLLQERMKDYKFSNSERIIVDYILDKQELIAEYSTKMIADETYTSPSTLIRISKKLGFSGWNELKEEYLNEINYIKSHFHNIDPNLPFTNQDTIMSIANKIVNLHIESAQDTMSLIHHDTLQKATQMILRSKEVRIFAVANLNYLAQEFAFKLNRIHKKAYIDITNENFFQDSLMMTKDECAICLSYSGETIALLKVAQNLKNNNVPMIAITSIGDNRLSKLSTVTLNVTTREKSFSKIAGFSSIESMSIVLNVLYSCFFSLNYQNNLDYKLKIARQIETNRIIDNDIILERPKED